MEEFGWIILFFLFWVFSSIGDIRKRQRKDRQEERDDARERDVSTGPRAGQRDLAADVAEGARRAEEALRRWEARQAAAEKDRTRTAAPGPEVELRRRLPDRRDFGIAEMGMHRETARARREPRAKRREAAELRRRAEVAIRDAEAERKDTKEAIAGMLADREVGSHREIRVGTSGTRRSAGSAGSAGLGRLDRLPPLKRAIVLREVLGPPKALSPGSDLP